MSDREGENVQVEAMRMPDSNTVIKKCSKEEYLMLREELLHADTMKNNIMIAMYGFIGAILAFAITQEDNLFVLLPYVVLIPSYAVVLGYDRTVYRIGSYLLVFHEEEDGEFQWESRIPSFTDQRNKNTHSLFKFIEAFNFPFLFTTLFLTALFFVRVDWSNWKTYDFAVRVAVALMCAVIMAYAIWKNRINKRAEFKQYWEEAKKNMMQRYREDNCPNNVSAK